MHASQTLFFLFRWFIGVYCQINTTNTGWVIRKHQLLFLIPKIVHHKRENMWYADTITIMNFFLRLPVTVTKVCCCFFFLQLKLCCILGEWSRIEMYMYDTWYRDMFFYKNTSITVRGSFINFLSYFFYKNAINLEGNCGNMICRLAS